MSSGPPLIRGGVRVRPNTFYRARPQVLRVVIQTIGRALRQTVRVVGCGRLYEPRFTRQLLHDFECARDNTPGTPPYDITHQPEQVITDSAGAVLGYRRLDFRLVFLEQLGRTGDYFCIEFKYLDGTDRSTDREYVDNGVDRMVSGEYALNHPWALMVGWVRGGSKQTVIKNVDSRLVSRYGCGHGFKATTVVRLSDVRESEHVQAGGPHIIRILHAFYSSFATVP